MQKVKIEKNERKDNLAIKHWVKAVDSNNRLSWINSSIYSYDSKSISIDLNPKVIHNYLDSENMENQIKALKSKDISNVIDINLILKQMDASQIMKSVLKDLGISISKQATLIKVRLMIVKIISFREIN